MLSLIILVFATLIFLVPLYAGNRFGMITPVSPLHILAYLAFFGVFIKATAYLIIGGEDAFFRQLVSNEYALVGGYFYLLLFTFCLTFGYIAGIRRRLHPNFPTYREAFFERSHRIILIFVIGLGVFFIAASVFLNARGFNSLFDLLSFDAWRRLNVSKITKIEGVEGFGNSFAAIKIFFILPAVTMLLLAAHASKRRTLPIMAMLAIMTVVVLVTILISGKRIGVLNLMIWFAVLYFFLGGKIRFKAIVGALTASALVAVIFIGMTTLRANKAEDSGNELWISESLSQIVNSTYFYDINMSIIVTDRIEMKDMLLGSSYTYWTYGWIPRAVWPSKPATSVGPYVKQKVFGIYGTIGGINPTGPGEAFINFGWFGCLIGATLGFLYRRCEEFLLSKRGIEWGGLILYPLLFFPFIQATLQSSFSASLVSAIVQGIIVVLFLYALGFIGRFRKRHNYVIQEIIQ